jgi:predicted dehydrogenase
MKCHVSRRYFLKGMSAAGAGVAVGPFVLRAAEVNKDKLRFAFIGTGGRGGAHTGLAKNDACVAYCDVDRSAWAKCAELYPKAKPYTDYRKLLETHAKEIDAVTVATPDHNHAPASMMAMKLGKHVYCEKPLTWSVNEARAMATAAREMKVATQMGNQGHANVGNRLVVEWVRGGAIGDVKEVHTWTNRPIWPQGLQQRPAAKPVPENLDWDSWLGPAAYRDYHEGLHRFAWRGWFDFGCGAVGDMGCHTWDCVFWAMNPDYPAEVELLKIVDRSQETFPKQSITRWKYPAKGNRPAFLAYWYEGGLKPEVPEEILNDPKREKKQLPGSASLFIGTKGKLLVEGDYGNSPRLIPETAMQDYKRPAESIPRSPGHHQEWIAACRGEKPWNYPGSNFAEYAGPLTENMLLAAMAQRIGEVGFKIECDAVSRTIKTKEALALAGREYRKGWVL